MYWYSLQDQRRMSIKQQHSCFVWDQLVNSQHFFYINGKLLRDLKEGKKIVTSTLDVGLFLSLAMIDSRLRWVHIPVGCARRRQAAFYFYFNRKFPLIFVSSRAHLLVKSQKAWKSIFVYEKKTIHIEKMVDFFFSKKMFGFCPHSPLLLLLLDCLKYTHRESGAH